MSTPVLSPLDFNKTELLNARWQNLGADPGGLTASDKGLMWINGTVLKYWDGAAVQTLGLSTGGDATTLDGQNGAYYLDRGNHSGTQTAATISDFTTAARGAISVTDTATLDLTYTNGAISGTVLDSPTVSGATAAQLRDRSTHSGTQAAATISDFNTAVRTNTLSQMAAPTAAVSMNSQKITNLADGSATADAVTYGQFIAVVEGRTWKEPVRAATTANITLSGAQTIDGVAVVAGNRVLVKNQTTASANGIYTVAAGAWTRAADADVAAELNNATVLVQEGGTNAGDTYTQTTTIVTLGTTAQNWAKTGEGNTVYAADSTTITLSGNTFSVGTIGASNIGVGAVDVTTTRVTGTMPATKGGTGQATTAVGDLLIGGATNTWTRLAAVAAGSVLKSAGAGAAPTWGKVSLTADVSGTLPIANGGTGATTAAAALTALGGARKLGFDVGGATDVTITHNLNTYDVSVDVFRNSGSREQVIVDVERPTLNTVLIRFATAPAAAAFRAVVVG